MAKAIVIGIDPGIAITRWSVLNESSCRQPLLIDCGTIKTNKKCCVPARLVEIKNDIAEIIKEFQPTNVAIEKPFFGRTITTAGKVLQAFGVINLVCYREGKVQPIYLHQASWKAFLGNGKADKKEVGEAVKQVFGLNLLPIDDTVDAIGIGYAALAGLENNIK